MKGKIKDMSLSEQGRARTLWAARQMPVLSSIGSRFLAETPFKGKRVGACLHISAKTANLMLSLRDGGAEISLCASNPLSTQDDIAAHLANEGIRIFAWRGEDEEQYWQNMKEVLSFSPHLLLDDGGDLTILYHQLNGKGVEGGTEETTTGITRIGNLAKQGKLCFPVLAVNMARTKHFFDNRYGTGQSALDGILRATNFLLAGSRIVVCGYGWVGRGIASRARGMGARVIVTEISPVKALEALMDGFEVMPIKQAAHEGEIFITATGGLKVISAECFRVMKDGVILANAGHFDVEIDIKCLQESSASHRAINEKVEEYVMPDGRKIFVLGQGRLVNLVCAEGHPAGVMDLSFANQALCLEYLVRKGKELKPTLYPVPLEIDEGVALMKLEAMGVRIDSLASEQQAYLDSFSWA